METTISYKEVELGRPSVYICKKTGKPFEMPVIQAFKESTAKRKILVAHRRGTKTSTALAEVFKYLMANPGIVGMTFAPVRKQAIQIIWDDPDMLFSKYICPPEIIKEVNKTEKKITLVNGSIYYLDGADDPQRKRGGNAKVVHFTEAGDHQEAIWTEIFEPVLVANGGIAIFEGNPRGRNWYYRLYNMAQTREGWDTFTQSVYDTQIFSEKELADLEASLPRNVFASEYLCEWVDSVGTVFRNYTNVTVLKQNTEPINGHSYRFGIDLAKVQDYTVISGVDKHTWDQVFIDRFNQLDWVVQKQRIKDWAMRYGAKENGNSVELLVESNSVGDPIIDDLWDWATSTEIKEKYNILITPFLSSAKSKEMLVSHLSMLIDQDFIKLLDHDILKAEMGEYTYTKTARNILYHHPEGGHDDTVMATMLSYWDLKGKLPLPQKEMHMKNQWGITDRHKKNANTYINPQNKYIL